MRALGRGHPVSQFLKGRLRLFGDLAAEDLEVVFERARLAARMGFRRAATAPAEAPPEFLHPREADTKTLSTGALRRVPSF